MFFFFNDTATTEIYTLSLHDALPISPCIMPGRASPGARLRRTPFTPRPTRQCPRHPRSPARSDLPASAGSRSEEHTSELQSRQYLVCRLLLEKKKKSNTNQMTIHIVR